MTPDHVNPERPWPALDELAAVTAEAGYDMVQRLTAQPKYVQAGAAWIDPRVRGHVVALADPATGLARDVNPVGMPWQEPDDVASWGRVDLGAAIDTQGRNTAVRSDLASAFGDWESIREQVHELAVRAPERIDTDVLAALRSAERAPAGCTDGEYLALATADGPALEAVAALADSLRRDVVGDEVTFVVNRNINFTNICYTGCRFCAFAQRKGDADAYSLSVGEVADWHGRPTSPGPPKYACRAVSIPSYRSPATPIWFVPSRRGCPPCMCTRFPRWRSPTASPRAG